VQAKIDEIQKLLRGSTTEAGGLFYKLQTAESFLQSLRRLIEAEGSGDPSLLQSAVAELRSNSFDRDLVSSRIGVTESKRPSNPIRKRRTKRERR
jgi:hypothetical protein